MAHRHKYKMLSTISIEIFLYEQNQRLDQSLCSLWHFTRPCWWSHNCILISSCCLQLGACSQQQAAQSCCSHTGRKFIIPGDKTEIFTTSAADSSRFCMASSYVSTNLVHCFISACASLWNWSEEFCSYIFRNNLWPNDTSRWDVCFSIWIPAENNVPL